jgi:hypothetical protein
MQTFALGSGTVPQRWQTVMLASSWAGHPWSFLGELIVRDPLLEREGRKSQTAWLSNVKSP